jgi:hypothetical protein
MVVSEIIKLVIISAVTIPLSALILMLATKMFKLKDKSYKTAIKITAITGVTGLILNLIGLTSTALTVIVSAVSWLGVSLLLAVWLIKSNYKLDWGKSLLVWLVWFLFSLVLGFIITAVIAFVLLAIGIGAAGAGLVGSLAG